MDGGIRTTEPGRQGFDVSLEINMAGAMFNNKYSSKDCNSVNNDVFSCIMEGFARALTKVIRESGVINKPDGIDPSSTYLAKGEAFIPDTFVRVQWEWIILPLLVWVLGLVTWAVIAFQSWRLRLPRWRDDTLPLMFLYRPMKDERGKHGDGGRLGAVTGSDELDEILRADGYSTWAYETVSEKISGQLHKPSDELESVGGACAMRLA